MDTVDTEDSESKTLAASRFHSDPRLSILLAEYGYNADMGAILHYGGGSFESVPSSLHLPLLKMFCGHLQDPMVDTDSEDEEKEHQLTVLLTFINLTRFLGPLEIEVPTNPVAKLLYQSCSDIFRCANAINIWIKRGDHLNSTAVPFVVTTLFRYIIFLSKWNKVFETETMPLADGNILTLAAELWLRLDLPIESNDHNCCAAHILNECLAAMESTRMINILEGMTRPRHVAEMALNRLRYASQVNPRDFEDVVYVSVTTLLHFSQDPYTATFQKIIDQRGVALFLKVLLKIQSYPNFAMHLSSCSSFTIKEAFVFLQNSTNVSMRSAELTCQALRNGLLEVTLKIGSLLSDHQLWEDTCPHIDKCPFLSDFLPCRFIFSAVIKAALCARNSLRDADLDVNLQYAALNDKFKGLWDGLNTLIIERAVAKALQSRKNRNRYCDNLLCRKCGQRGSFYKCAGCETSLYCSRECQIISWKNQGHKKACTKLRSSSTRIDHSAVGRSDRSFLTYLAHLEVSRHLSALREIAFKRFPNVPFEGISFTIDFRVCPPILDVQPESCVLNPSSKPTVVILQAFIIDVLRRRQYATASKPHIGSVVEIIAPTGGEHYVTFLCLSNTDEQSNSREALDILESGLRLGGKKRGAFIDAQGNALCQGDPEYDEVDEVVRRLTKMAAKSGTDVYDQQLIFAAADDYLEEVAEAIALSRLRLQKVDTA